MIQPEKKENNQVTSTQIAWIAKGYWDKRYSWRMYPGTLLMWIWTVISGSLLAVLLLISGIMYKNVHTPSFATILGCLLIAFTLGFWFWGAVRYRRAKDDFIDDCVEHWENGEKTLPTYQSVIDFTEKDCKKPGK